MVLSQFKENELYRFRQMVILTLLRIDHAQREDRTCPPGPAAICYPDPPIACSYAEMRRSLAARMGLHGSVN